MAEKRGYGVLHRLWPGTQRVLLSGDPETASAYGRVSSFCGSVGMEIFEPLFFKGRKGSGLPGGRLAYADASLQPANNEFEKYHYTYRVWGRGLYNPEGGRECSRRWLRKQFGSGAEAAENALAAASKILPLVVTAHCPSAANNNYWPEMYTDMPIVLDPPHDPYGDTPSPRRFGTVSPLDTEFFLTVEQFADELIAGQSSGKHSPAWVAGQLEDHAKRAEEPLREAKSRVSDAHGPEFRRLEADVAIQIGLGRFFAGKFRAATLYALHTRSNQSKPLEEALKVYREARSAWAKLAEDAKGTYASDVTYGPEAFQRGHWLDRLPAIDRDVAAMEQRLIDVQNGRGPVAVELDVVEQAVRNLVKPPKEERRPNLESMHTPAASFQRGALLTIQAQLPKDRSLSGVTGITLRYRRINQAEIWQTAPMDGSGAEYSAVIAGEYTNSDFPLQYHFQIHEGTGAAWLYPGLQPGWRSQPYFYVRQA